MGVTPQRIMVTGAGRCRGCRRAGQASAQHLPEPGLRPDLPGAVFLQFPHGYSLEPSKRKVWYEYLRGYLDQTNLPARHLKPSGEVPSRSPVAHHVTVRRPSLSFYPISQAPQVSLPPGVVPESPRKVAQSGEAEWEGQGQPCRPCPHPWQQSVQVRTSLAGPSPEGGSGV